MSPIHGVGEQLRQARTDLQLSLQDVTRATKIQPWILEALETDQLQKTTSPVYVKGFLTTYAKCLRLEPQALIAQLFPEPPPQPASAPAEPGIPLTSWIAELPWDTIRRVGTLALGCAALVVLIKIAPVRWLSAHALHQAPHREASLTLIEKQVPIPQAAAVSLEPAHPLELAVVAQRPTWVSVKADDHLLAQQQLNAGSRESWTARRRFELIVAKPSQVDVLLNGQSISPLAIAHHGRLLITHTSIQPLPDLPAAPRASKTTSSR